MKPFKPGEPNPFPLYKPRWWEKKAGPGWYLVMICIVAASWAIVLSGCSVDTSRPDYGKVRLFQTQDEIDRQHELWRHRQQLRSDRRHDRWKARHGIH